MSEHLSNYWKTTIRKTFIRKIIKFNNKNKFNFVEKGNYNHTEIFSFN